MPRALGTWFRHILRSIVALLAIGGLTASLSAQTPNPAADAGELVFRPYVPPKKCAIRGVSAEDCGPCAPWAPAPGVPNAPFQSQQPSQPFQPGQPSQPGTLPTQPSAPGTSPSQPDMSSSQPGMSPDGSGSPPPTNFDAAAGSGAFGQAPSAGTGGGNTFNVNMFGDALGRHSVQIVSSRTFSDTVRFTGTGSTDVQYQNNNHDLVTLSNSNSISSPHSLFGVVIGNPSFVAASPLVATPSGSNHSTNSPLVQNTQVTSALQSSLAGPGQVVQFVSGLATVSNPSPNLHSQQYSIFEVYKLVSTTQIATSGGEVGRQKMSEDTSPIPRDRLIFDYDYFNGATLTPGGIDVHRIVVGFEKTFLDGRASIEVRLPFASTLDSTSTLGMESRNMELGDLRITPRLLAYSSETVNVGAGLGIYLPTAADTRVRNPDGSDLVRFSNDSVTLSPYIGVLLTPNDRLFSQEWVSVDFDTAGSAVSGNVDGNGVQNLGRYRNGNQLNLDAQVGYWLINPQDNNPRLRGLAPFVELHYGSNTSNPSTLQLGDLQIGGGNRGDELNLTAGVMFQFGNRLNLQVGASAPVINSDSRNFNWQIGFRLNWFFGGPADLPARAAFIP
jgi:hypothetical protein